MSEDVRRGGDRNNVISAASDTTTHIPWRGLVMDIEMISGARAAKKTTTEEEKATENA